MTDRERQANWRAGHKLIGGPALARLYRKSELPVPSPDRLEFVARKMSEAIKTYRSPPLAPEETRKIQRKLQQQVIAARASAHALYQQRRTEAETLAPHVARLLCTNPDQKPYSFPDDLNPYFPTLQCLEQAEKTLSGPQKSRSVDWGKLLEELRYWVMWGWHDVSWKRNIEEAPRIEWSRLVFALAADEAAANDFVEVVKWPNKTRADDVRTRKAVVEVLLSCGISEKGLAGIVSQFRRKPQETISLSSRFSGLVALVYSPYLARLS